MNILIIGDVVGEAGRDALAKHLPQLKHDHDIGCTIVNGENAAGGAGLTPRIAEELYRAGADVLTLGDHVWDKPELVEYLNEKPHIVRPANFPEGAPGKGWCVFGTPGGTRVGVINLLGRVFMRYNVDCPFRKLQSILEELKGKADLIFLDMHAETTSEKVAMGVYSDGRLTGVVGTHTHIQTADERVLPKGTAYITDLGMTGPYDSVIGQNKDKILQRFLTSMPVRFEVAKDDVRIHGVVIGTDPSTGRASSITRVQRRME